MVTTRPIRQEARKVRCPLFPFHPLASSHFPRFYPIEIDYLADDEDNQAALKQKAKEMKSKKSKLDKRVQEIVELIFDIKAMQDTLVEMEIDIRKMPLGKLSKRNIQQGVHQFSFLCSFLFRTNAPPRQYQVLTEIQSILKTVDPSTTAFKTRLTECANRFYTYVFGHFVFLNVPPLSDFPDRTGSLSLKLDSP